MERGAAGCGRAAVAHRDGELLQRWRSAPQLHGELIYALINARWTADKEVTFWREGEKGGGSCFLTRRLPPKRCLAQDGFFTIASIGGYARAGVARWARTQITDPCSTFALIQMKEGEVQWDVAHDYFLLAIHQQVVGRGVLTTAGDAGSDAAVYAYCGVAPGSVVVTAVNVGNATLALVLAGVVTTPRLEWVFTAPGGNLSALAPLLNGNQPPLRLAPDGSLPAMPPVEVIAGGAAALTMPPLSQAFFVLLASKAPACF